MDFWNHASDKTHRRSHSGGSKVAVTCYPEDEYLEENEDNLMHENFQDNTIHREHTTTVCYNQKNNENYKFCADLEENSLKVDTNILCTGICPSLNRVHNNVYNNKNLKKKICQHTIKASIDDTKKKYCPQHSPTLYNRQNHYSFGQSEYSNSNEKINAEIQDEIKDFRCNFLHMKDEESAYNTNTLAGGHNVDKNRMTTSSFGSTTKDTCGAHTGNININTNINTNTIKTTPPVAVNELSHIRPSAITDHDHAVYFEHGLYKICQ